MVVFFDIDGTLIDDATQTIPESAVRAVEQLGKNGHLAVINTGRPYHHIDSRIREMAFQGWVCGCGMEIRMGDTWLRREHPTRAICREVIAMVKECRMQVIYEAQNGDIFLDGDLSQHPWVVHEAGNMKNKGFGVHQLADLEDPYFMKLVTFDGPDSRREEFIRRVSRYYNVTDRGNTMLEMVLGNCSKAEGMKGLLQHLQTPVEQTLAIGDSANDLPMFRLAGHTVCMGNGLDIVKRQAEFITGSVLEDGIETALKHYGLI